MHFCRHFRNWVLKVDLGRHLRDKHWHLFLWEVDLIFPSFNVGKHGHIWDLDTHLRAKHGHIFLWDLELFWPSFKISQTNIEKIHFCWLSRNWVLKVDLGTHLRDNNGHLFLWYFGAILALVQSWSNQGWKYALLSTLSELKF